MVPLAWQPGLIERVQPASVLREADGSLLSFGGALLGVPGARFGRLTGRLRLARANVRIGASQFLRRRAGLRLIACNFRRLRPAGRLLPGRLGGLQSIGERCLLPLRLLRELLSRWRSVSSRVISVVISPSPPARPSADCW